jgi:hypothetical protein
MNGSPAKLFAFTAIQGRVIYICQISVHSQYAEKNPTDKEAILDIIHARLSHGFGKHLSMGFAEKPFGSIVAVRDSFEQVFDI